ncbi:hypothetical protein LL912_05965 [Niabella sp. CC-SYL272]|uniref:hypothetical protein n=1 Tax=Niabella agricola TaxID=2891571 RepID=UPI001F3B70AA|nr:hypothetical protein [Niabella agricola]MCF3108317.1 hypothetical protein [Niabella agricola]
MRPPAKPKEDGIFSPDFRHKFPVSFTGDAINQLSASEPALFDIREWIWHIEVINGVEYCVVTDRLPHPETTGQSSLPVLADPAGVSRSA